MRSVGGFVGLAFVLCQVFSSTASELKLRKISDTVLDAAALHFTNGSWGLCVNGETFQQDALTSFKGFQYATYYDAERHLCVGRRVVGAENWEIIRFRDYHFKGNDTHNVAVIGICPRDGTIHLSFDHHGSPLHYRVSQPQVALHPKKFVWSTNLFSATRSELEPGKKLSHVTYPRFFRTPEGGLQFSCRIGGSGDGEKCLADYDGKHGVWKNFGACFGSTGTYLGQTTRNPYLNGYNYDREGRLHVTWCWRETGDPTTNHDLNYAWSDDRGVTWRNNIGQNIGERGKHAVTVESPGVAVVEIPMNRGLINATTQAIDSRNRIHLLTAHLSDSRIKPADWKATRQQSHYFHYWRDEKGRWQRNEIDFIASRPQLWFDSHDNAYLICVGEDLIIAAATAKSHWTDWKIVHRETGPFESQPQIDRYCDSDNLFVYVQKAATVTPPLSSALHVFQFKP